LDKWIYFIKYASDLTLIPKEYQDIQEFKEAFDIATQTSWNQKEFDEINALRTAEEKGMKKGIKEGIEKGIEKGIEEGEKKKAYEIAKKSLGQGLDLETIKMITGLSDEELKNIIKMS